MNLRKLKKEELYKLYFEEDAKLENLTAELKQTQRNKSILANEIHHKIEADKSKAKKPDAIPKTH
jgi:hypothetical protein